MLHLTFVLLHACAHVLHCCCSGYRGITCVDFCSKVLQAWRKRSADAGHTSLKYQHADIVTGLAFEHYPVRDSRQPDVAGSSMLHLERQEDSKQRL
jgi:hypothetical protein